MFSGKLPKIGKHAPSMLIRRKAELSRLVLSSSVRLSYFLQSQSRFSLFTISVTCCDPRCVPEEFLGLKYTGMA
jgi:hypothetical protein